MKYEEPTMEILQINMTDIVTTMSIGADFNESTAPDINFGS